MEWSFEVTGAEDSITDECKSISDCIPITTGLNQKQFPELGTVFYLHILHFCTVINYLPPNYIRGRLRIQVRPSVRSSLLPSGQISLCHSYHFQPNFTQLFLIIVPCI